MTRPVVVADSGPLVALAVCGQLELLIDVFDAIHVPQAVLDETTADRSRPGANDIAAFVHVHARIHVSRNDNIYAAAVSHLDEGEAQALSLAHALDCGVLMDERRGRETATRLELMQDNGYRVSRALVEATLKLAGESA